MMSVVDINTISLAGNWGNDWVITNNEEYLEKKKKKTMT